jgi:ATP-dependent protease HslVU (ClpYQ) peptidase subunit
MTCLVAWRGLDATMVGTDSQWTAGSQKGTLVEGKMWRNGRFLLAMSGSVRVTQVLRYGVQFNPAIKDGELEAHLVREWMPAVLKQFEECGLLVKDEDKQVCVNFEGLIVSRRKIMRVGQDFTVVDEPLHYAAAGSGEEVALGFLAAQRRSDRHPAYGIVSRTLGAAEKHITNVSGPYHIERVR